MNALSRELGISHVLSSHSQRDCFLLLASRFARLFAFGAVSPILVLYLIELGHSSSQVGLFLSLTLIGDVLLSLAVTFVADSLGRRRVLAFGAILMGLSGVVFATSQNYYVLLAASIVGVISPAGGEVGPFAAVEVGMLSQLVAPTSRVYLLTFYQCAGFFGTSVGSFISGVIVSSLINTGSSNVYAYRAIFYLYSLVAISKISLSLAMTTHSELDHPPIPVKSPRALDGEQAPLLPGTESPPRIEEADSKPIPEPLPMIRLVLICLLFSLDSFASSLIPISFISYYFRLQFNASIEAITRTFGAGALIAGFSQLAAGSIAKRIGIIPTMVGTHMPAQLLTISLAFAPTLSSALTLFLARSVIASMDTSVRGAFLSAIVPKGSRTRFLGIVNVCKTLATAPGATISGILAEGTGLRWSFVITGCIKLIYDVSLWIGFKTASLDH